LNVNDADNKQPVSLPPTDKGAKPASLGAKDAAPKKKMDEEISMQEQSRTLDDEMKANNITEGQLKSSNEPSFQEALDQKKGAQKDAADKPKLYQKEEGVALKAARDEAGVSSSVALNTMHASRGKNFDASVKEQQSSKQKDEDQRALVAKEVERLYTEAETKVNTALTAADTESAKNVDPVFDPAVKAGYMSQEAKDKLKANVIGAYSTEQRNREQGILNSSLAGMQLILAATAKGWNTCAIGGFNEQAFKDNFLTDTRYIPTMLIAIGKEKVAGHPTSRFSAEKMSIWI